MIECKRAKDTDWIFLRDSGEGGAKERLITRAWVTSRRHINQPEIFEWTDFTCTPGSPLAEFCIVRKNNQRSQELIEKSAAEVVRAAEAIAREELDRIRNRDRRLSKIYLPMIVTTARLYICDCDYKTINLDRGEIANTQMLPTPLIRFQKSLSTQTAAGGPATLEEAAAAAERTVVIIQASAFLEILDQWDTSNLASGLAQ